MTTSRRGRHVALLVSIFGVLVSTVTHAAPVTLTDARGVRVRIADTSRIVTLGSAVTETVAALGAADRLVGVDASSSYPAEALAELPRTGYVRSVGAEGVLALAPTLVLGAVDVGPPEVIDQIASAGVPVVIVPEEDSFAGAVARVEFVARAIGAEAEARGVVSRMREDEARASELVAAISPDERPRVLFIYARGVGSLLVSGTGTSADAIIGLGGGANAVTEFSGYRPLTAEAVIGAAPDVLLFFDSGLASIGGRSALAEIPGIALTPAWAEGGILAFPGDFLLNFGPRTGAAALALAEALYDVAP